MIFDIRLLKDQASAQSVAAWLQIQLEGVQVTPQDSSVFQLPFSV